MGEPLDELYLRWLYSQVADTEVKNPSFTYWGLLRQLYKKEFVWIIPNDDNRLEDGKSLRYEFAEEVSLLSVDNGWLNMGCSMLEIFVVLSRKLSFLAEGEPSHWFWHMLKNVRLHKCNDRAAWFEDVVDENLDRIIWRTYTYNGRGGIFPLKESCEDQRHVELWYQLNAYVQEQG